MTEPDMPELRAAVEQAEPATPALSDALDAARRRRRRRAAPPLLAAVVAVFVAGGVAAVALPSGSERSEGLVQQPVEPGPAPVSPTIPPSTPTAPTPVRTTPAPADTSEPPQATTGPRPTGVPTSTAPSSTAPSAAPVVTEPLSMTVTTDRRTARVGDVVTLTLVLRNDGPDAFTMLIDTACPEQPFALAFTQDVAVPARAEASAGEQALRRSIDGTAISTGYLPSCVVAPDLRPVQLEPRSEVRRMFTWTAATTNGSAYDGTVHAFVAATVYDARSHGHTVEDQLDLRVSGGDSARLSPAQAFDRAVADSNVATELAALGPDAAGALTFLADRPPAFMLRFERNVDGMLSGIRAVTVDGDTGEVGQVGEGATTG